MTSLSEIWLSVGVHLPEKNNAAKFYPDDRALGYFQEVAPTTTTRGNLISVSNKIFDWLNWGHTFTCCGICTKLTLLTVFVYVKWLTVSSKEAPLDIGNGVVPAAVVWATFFLWYSWIATVSASWRRVTLTNYNKPRLQILRQLSRNMYITVNPPCGSGDRE